MKKSRSILVIFLAVCCLLLFTGIFTACDGGSQNGIEIPDWGTTATGKTELSVSGVESGSATLKVNNEGCDHYLFEVSRYSAFAPELTKKIYSQKSEYKLFFDDNSKLFVRATAVLPSGSAYGVSDTQTIEGKSVQIAAQDDFREGGALIGWELVNLKAKSDFHSAVVQSTTTAGDSASMKKTFSVDLDAADIFEIKFQTKNSESEIDVLLHAADKTIEAVKDMTVVEEGYIRADLSALGLTGVQDIRVEIISTGLNRGFQLDYVRFLSEGEHIAATAFLENEYTNQYNQISVENEGLVIENDAEPLVIDSPSVDVNFNPAELPLLEIGLSGYRAIDTFTVRVKDIQGKLLLEDTKNAESVGGKLSYNLYEDYGITEEGQYNFSYEVSNERVEVTKMQLVGEGEGSVPVTHDSGWTNGASAFINDNDEIRLKEGVIYNYGDINKEITVNLDTNPIVFFDVEAVSGSWAVKIVPEGASGDIRLTPDTSETGVSAYDLRSVLSGTGEMTVKFVIFVIGGSAADQSCYVKMNPIQFGNAQSVIPEKTDEVVSEIRYDLGKVNIDNFGFITIDVVELSKGASWKLYLCDEATGRSYEMKTILENKYPLRYFRTKEGKYVFDIGNAMKLDGEQELSVRLTVTGNSARAIIRDVSLTDNNNIPVEVC